jgi:hypothetical protein
MKTNPCNLCSYPRQLVNLGLFGLALALGHAQPANDNFANATLITGQTAQVTGSNVGATMETGEPTTVEGWAAGQSVWWRWTAPFAGSIGPSTAGRLFPQPRADI